MKQYVDSIISKESLGSFSLSSSGSQYYDFETSFSLLEHPFIMIKLNGTFRGYENSATGSQILELFAFTNANKQIILPFIYEYYQTTKYTLEFNNYSLFFFNRAIDLTSGPTCRIGTNKQGGNSVGTIIPYVDINGTFDRSTTIDAVNVAKLYTYAVSINLDVEVYSIHF